MKAYGECTHAQEESARIRGGVEDFFVLTVQNKNSVGSTCRDAQLHSNPSGRDSLSIIMIKLHSVSLFNP